MEPDTEPVLELAAIIRKVDGSHTLGAAALAEAILAHPRSRWLPDPEHTDGDDLEGEARSLLSALPEAEGGPTDKDIDALERSMWETTGVNEQLQREEVFNYREFMRKGLALWGSPTPVLLSDREPTPQECDNEGRCWWFHPAERGSSHPLISKDWWVLSSYKGGELWLPYWVFPAPCPQANQPEDHA